MGFFDAAISRARADAGALHQHIQELEAKRNTATGAVEFAELDAEVTKLIPQSRQLHEFLERVEAITPEDRQLLDRYHARGVVAGPIFVGQEAPAVSAGDQNTGAQ